MAIWIGGRVPMRPPYFSLTSLKAHLCHQLAFLAIIGSLVAALNAVLYKLNGSGVTCASIWESHMDRKEATLGDAVIFYLIMGPFLDIAETVKLASRHCLHGSTADMVL